MRADRPGPFDLDAGTSEPYEDAALYDHEYRRRKDDVRAYVRLARAHGRRALELGCGSGRVLVPLVRAGLRVVGLDRSAAMLARACAARARLSRPQRARMGLLRADMRRFALSAAFPFVAAPFNVFMHLYHPDAVLRCLACVRAHLAPGGRFAFDVTNPDPRLLAREGPVRWSAKIRHPADGRLYRYGVERRYDRARQIDFVRIHFQPLDGGRTRIVHLAHRVFYPREIESLLRLGGFRLIERWGGFDGQAFDDRAAVQLCVAAPDGEIVVSRRKIS
jgi:SAM-dependent methyltransferase